MIKQENAKKVIKVNIGCGPNFKDDWCNVEYGALSLINKIKVLKRIVVFLGILDKDMLQKWPKDFIYHNVMRPLPFKDESVDYIYSSHVFEHFRRYQLRRVLKNIRNSMKSGGVMRVVIPDIDMIILNYNEEKDPIKAAEVFNKNFFTDLIDSSLQKPNLIQRLIHFFSRPHRWLYNKESFIEELKVAGFIESNIFIREYKMGVTPDIKVLDKLPEQSMYIEVVK
jgi:SAM-dependent methyltransferase